MKKELFEVWYHEYGRDLAKDSLPIDDVEEKEIRRKAKKIFSSMYDMFSNFMNDRLNLVYEQIIDNINFLNNAYNEWSVRKNSAEIMRDKSIPHLTKLYDSYYNEKSIGKEQFDSLRHHFAEIVENSRHTIKDADKILSEIKHERKLLESLLITE